MRAAGQEIYEYFGNLIDERRAQPADDIITRFVQTEIDGEKLTRNDILDICFLFLIAGLDTVSDTLTCSYAFLATHPEHRQMIVDDPSIIPPRWRSCCDGSRRCRPACRGSRSARSTCQRACTSTRARR